MSDPQQGDTNESKPKIIVDTDWKEQVAKERESADQVEPAAGEPVRSSAASSDGSDPPIPPATFEVLVTMLFTQAMTMLVPEPGAEEFKPNKPVAKHYIDTIDMLQEKTQGNLSDDETKILSEALHALRMTYVSAKA